LQEARRFFPPSSRAREARVLRRRRPASGVAASPTSAASPNTAIFSFVDVLLLRQLPYPNADRLYATVSIHRGRGIDLVDTIH
jgi:plasmid replication initiation protein